MQHRIEIALQLLVFVVAGVLAGFAAAPQGNAPPSLQEQLEAQYQLTKMNGDTLVPGTVLVIQKEGAFGVATSIDSSPAAAYKDGALHPPGASALAHFGKDIRPLPKGDKVYVRKLVINLKEDWIMLHIIECGACDGVIPAGSYKSVVGFQFAKGYLKTASVPDIEDTIAQVFDIYTPPETPPAPASETSGLAMATAGQGLTNDDIIKLVRAKLPDSLIISKMQSSACAFDTGPDQLVRLKQAGVSDDILQAMVNAGNQPVGPPPPPPGGEVPPPAPGAETPPPADCTDYASCLAGGSAAIYASQWDRSLADLQKASNLEPTEPEAWADMGLVYLAIGQYQNAVAMWDKALGLGGTLTFGVLYVQGLHLGKTGTFQLSAKEISLVGADQQKGFSVGPTEVSSVKSHRLIGLKVWSFSLKLESRNYAFDFVPLGGHCMKAVSGCDPSGYSQEETVSNYVAQTIAKLAPGSVGK